MDPAAPPRAPFLFEHHFFAADNADISAFQTELEERGYQLETLSYDPLTPERAWSAVALKLDLLEERRVLALSDEMDELARRHGLVYDGWLTRIE